MKLSKLNLVIFSILFIMNTCEDKRAIFANNIRKYIQAVTRPSRTNEFISNFETKLTLLFYTLTIKELDEVQVKYDLSDSLMLQIKSARFVTSSGMKKVEESNPLNYYSHEESLGAALKENDGRISFALIKTKSFAILKPKYETYTTEECHRVWIFFKKCHDVEHQRERELTNPERIIVRDAVKYSAINSIKEAVDVLKKGDYELYMYDTGSIFSPDHKSVAHLTYFGNIAIGPTSELNAILPIDYQYEVSKFGKNKGSLVKSFKGNVITSLKNYPKVRIYSSSKFLFGKEGKLYKFNFLREHQIMRFPGQCYDYIFEEAKKGPFVLEVKKNGEVLLYAKNNPDHILWTTNTANKGTGPYNLHLTNDKKLILEDSTGKILYQSPDYKEVPTIYYGNAGEKGKHVYNGFFGNTNGYNTPIYPDKLDITTDNNKYRVQFHVNQKITPDRDYTYRKENKIDLFWASFIGSGNDFDICYIAKVTRKGWTRIACNGNKVGFDYSSTKYEGKPEKFDPYIVDLIIYVKEKGEPVHDINNNPYVFFPMYPDNYSTE